MNQSFKNKIEENEQSNLEIFSELDKIVDDTINVLEFITDRMNYINVIMVEGIHYDIQCTNLISCIRTLKNIKYCCHNFTFADANVLLRKYRDDLFQYLYFQKVINKYQEAFCTEESISNDLKMHIGYILAWRMNRISTYSNSQKEKFKNAMSASAYKNYLQKDETIKECCELFFKQTWKDINESCNNYMHNNSKKNIADNLRIISTEKKKCLMEITENIKLLSIYFASLLLLIRSHVFSSIDYEYALERGDAPVENSQYWIASLYQKYFNNYIDALSPELLEYLRKNNSHGMIIE